MVILLALNSNILCQELTNDDIKFAARYILYLEKRDSLNTEIIKAYEIKSIDEEYARNLYANIDSLQNKQLETYDRILDKLHHINTSETEKTNFVTLVLTFIFGVLVGRY